MNIQKKLEELSEKIKNKYIKKEIEKIAEENKKRTSLLIDLNELESLVNSEKVEYEDFIGDISIDK